MLTLLYHRRFGYCGTTDDYCSNGCQPAYGSGCQGSGSTTSSTITSTTTSPSSSSSSSSSTTRTTTKTTSTKTTTTKTTTTKTTTTKTTTTKSTTTKTTTTRTTTASPTSTAHPISKDGTCGPKYGYTCIGSAFGSCCNGLTNTCVLLCLIGNCVEGYGTCPLL
ncbi:hypothetical protein F4678DRAFT_76621 [Xylaria arbuscula]|nr:hypothetical protein F4678DRAFT_76621 [Xylaria arbuscula]